MKTLLRTLFDVDMHSHFVHFPNHLCISSSGALHYHHQFLDGCCSLLSFNLVLVVVIVCSKLFFLLPIFSASLILRFFFDDLFSLSISPLVSIFSLYRPMEQSKRKALLSINKYTLLLVLQIFQMSLNDVPFVVWQHQSCPLGFHFLLFFSQTLNTEEVKSITD